MGVIIPLITFPYSSRVLGPEALGKVDYAQANMTYFTLLQAFGIGSYAIREGARIRDDKKKMDEFASEMLSINLVTAGVAYVLFFAALAIPRFADYRSLMLLFSTSIILSTIGVEWLYNIYEEYQYITIRSFVFQIISVVMLFTCVKSEEDYMIYALTMVLSSVGSNVLNFVRARKYVKFHFRFSSNLLEHIKPMTYIFLMDVASSVYLVMDRSMLGYITGDNAEVGLYAAAIKIASVLTSFFTAIWAIMRPRIAYTLERDMVQAKKLTEITGRLILMFNIPSAIGLCLLSKQILLLISGQAYVTVSLTLKILLINVIFATFNGFLVNLVCIVNRMDRCASNAVIIGAIVNVVLNSIAIPYFGKEGAAVATLLSELSILIYTLIKCRLIVSLTKMLRQGIQALLGTCAIVAIYFVCMCNQLNYITTMFITIVCGAVLYIIVLLLFRNDIMLIGLDKVKSFIHHVK